MGVTGGSPRKAFGPRPPSVETTASTPWPDDARRPDNAVRACRCQPSGGIEDGDMPFFKEAGGGHDEVLFYSFSFSSLFPLAIAIVPDFRRR